MPFIPKPSNGFPPGLLSDHAYQSIQVMPFTKEHQTSVPVNIGTWNLQDFCKSAAKNGGNFSNNPFDVDETTASFKARKEAQIQQIIENLKNGGDDFLFLQECDFLFPTKYRGNKDEGLNFAKIELAKNLKEKLDGIGYGIILADGSTQKIATLYNLNKFSVQSPSNLGVFPGANKNRGMESRFTINGTNPPLTVVATNLHLQYGCDYKDEIEKYQIKMEQEGVLHIMGGDTNNIQTENLNTAVGDWNQATNFQMVKDQKGAVVLDQQGWYSLSTIHDSKPEFQKAYDRFFVVPPKEHYLGLTTNNARNQKVVIGDDGYPQMVNTTAKKQSVSRVGERWRRGVDILEKLWEKSQVAGITPSEQTQIHQEMRDVAQWKAISKVTLKKYPLVFSADQNIMPIPEPIDNVRPSASNGGQAVIKKNVPDLNKQPVLMSNPKRSNKDLFPAVAQTSLLNPTDFKGKSKAPQKVANSHHRPKVGKRNKLETKPLRETKLPATEIKPQKVISSVKTASKIKQNSFPPSYQTLFDEIAQKNKFKSPEQLLILQSKALLQDYSKKGAGFWRIIHPLRHYVSQVSKLTENMNNTKPEDLIRALEAIKNADKDFNPKGSFARRLAFIKIKYQEIKEFKPNSIPQ